jgi:alpha-D-ribose 1-methylphosphonate 5-triphosphate diphosphatase
MGEQVYTNYLLQLPDEELLGTIIVQNGIITDIQPGKVFQGENGEGDYLIPGLVELHTDNLEQCILVPQTPGLGELLERRFSPRPKMHLPLEVAAVYHDRQVASAGITTVCDAIAIGDSDPLSIRATYFHDMIDTICTGHQEDRFLVDHRLHLRCEVSNKKTYNITEKYADQPVLTLISLIDHTTKLLQSLKLDNYNEYYMDKHGIAEAEIKFIKKQIENQQRYAKINRSQLVELTRARNICLATHDDNTREQVRESSRNGSEIAEFPTTLDAAEEARVCGLKVLMGAPNFILGKSHSSNVSAMDLAERDLVDVISSDYIPQSSLSAMFLIAQRQQKPLHEVIRLFSLNPAKAIKLDSDRGSLEVGKRADFITVHCDSTFPYLTSVVCKGKRIA